MTMLAGLLGARNSVESPAVPLTSTSLLDWMGGPRSHAGVSVTEQSSMGMPAVWRAVNLIAGTAASLPLHAYRNDDESRLAVRTGQAAALLDIPHPDLTAYELWETVYGHMLLWGNAYLRILRNPLGQVAELWPLHPSCVRVGRDSVSALKVYEVTIDGVQTAHTDQTILHLPGFGYDGVCGVSAIRAARQGIGLALAAEEYGARLFGSGSLASGILQTEHRLEQAQADALKARWKARSAGLNNAHDVVVLDSGAKFQQLTIPPEDAQFIESRRFQVSEVARMFGVPPHMLMDTEKSTSWGAGIEQQSIGFVVYTMRPWLVRVEQRLTRLLRPTAVYAKYTVEGLLRGDSASRAAFYTAMLAVGGLSPNEIREYEDKPPIPGGDVHYRPLNYGVIGQADPAPQPVEAPPNAA